MFRGSYRILLATLVLYTLTIAVALLAGQTHLNHGHTGPLAPRQLGWAPLILVPYMIAIIFARSERLKHNALRLGLAIILGLGITFAFQHFFLEWRAWPYGAVIFIAMVIAARRVVTHNLSLLIGIAGLAALMGLYFSPYRAALGLMAFALYDFFAVYVFRHTVQMAGEMVHAGAIFGFIVPTRLSGWLLPTVKALDRDDVLVVGASDIGIPIMVAVAMLPTNPQGALLVSAFVLLGAVAVFWLFFSRLQRTAVAALPPLAASTLVGYAIVLMLRLL